jgi:hypothetical protein
MDVGNTMMARVGFRLHEKCLLGFEVKARPQGDVYVLVFERGYRRMHVSYHKDGRVNHNVDRPNQASTPVMWDVWGAMEPMVRYEAPVKEIVGRQRVAGAGWVTQDIEKAGLPEFAPSSDDIIVVPETPTVGFSINIISPGTRPRKIGNLRLPVLSRFERGAVPIVEIETFDWLAPQSPPKQLVTSIRFITPRDDVWVLDDNEQFNTLDEAQAAVVAKYGEPHQALKRRDGGVNVLYQHVEDDPFDL